MVFSSVIFILLFLPLTLYLYFLPRVFGLKAHRWQNLVLLFSSLLFYSWGEGAYLLVMLGSVAMNWAAALLIERCPRSGRLLLLLAMALNLLLLGYYKYAGFVYENLFALAPSVMAALRPYMVDVHLPIGVSFFTFQAMSYVIDVYRKDVPAQRNVLKLALYITFFPQLIAGPIVRYRDVALAIDQRTHSVPAFSYGVQRFIAGLAQKVLLANTLGEVADKLFALPAQELSPLFAWSAAIAYMFQIYYDFCGYSNMAIGIARMFGFRFLENFDHPYSAYSITEFWRRWHISLSTWFRDYVYIPLGGNRKGRLATYRNLFIVFALCGLWHGASWSFVVWGLYHGALLTVERTALGAVIALLPKPAARCYTLSAVLLGWIVFRVETLDGAALVIGRMFGAGEWQQQLLVREVLSLEVICAAALAALFAIPPARLRRWAADAAAAIDAPPNVQSSPSLALLGGQLVVLVLVLSYLAAGHFNPFIYFRF